MWLRLDALHDPFDGQIAHRPPEGGDPSSLEREQAYRSVSERRDQRCQRSVLGERGLQALSPDHPEHRRTDREPRGGALFSLGDTHAAQGDGEVCGTAIETAMDAVVRLTVRKDVRVDAPEFDIPAGLTGSHELSSYHVCTGVGPDLLEAARDSLSKELRLALQYPEGAAV